MIYKLWKKISKFDKIFCMTEPIQPRSSLETPPPLEIERFMERMDQRHQIATAAWNLEQYLMAATPDTIAETSKKLNLDMLDETSPQLANRFRELIQLYGEKKITAETTMHYLTTKLFPDNAEHTPAEWGEKFFTLCTKEQQKGIVEFEQQEGYFIISLEHPEDYALIRNKKDVDENSGCFSGEFTITQFGITIPIIIIKGEKEKLDTTVTHERQHFINGILLEYFLLDEYRTAGKPKKISLQAEKCALKDELLAYMRDGSSSQEIFQSLTSSNYAWMFKNQIDSLDAQTTFDPKQLLQDITTALTKLGLLFCTPKERALLIYHLIDIPLEKIPRYLERLKQWHEQRMKELNEYNTFIKEQAAALPSPIVDDPVSIQKQIALQAHYKEIQTLILTTGIIPLSDCWQELQATRLQTERLRLEYEQYYSQSQITT